MEDLSESMSISAQFRVITIDTQCIYFPLFGTAPITFPLLVEFVIILSISRASIWISYSSKQPLEGIANA